MERGYVQVYTGEGKGKTTAALGLALRAVGRDLKVVVFQFLKGTYSGELAAASRLGLNLVIRRFAPIDKPIWQLDEAELQELKKAIIQGFDDARIIARDGSCDLIILDEILGAVSKGFVTTEQLCNLIREKSPQVELILTGRNAPPEILDLADLVTEMKAVKHYYQQGVQARDGIER